MIRDLKIDVTAAGKSNAMLSRTKTFVLSLLLGLVAAGCVSGGLGGLGGIGGTQSERRAESNAQDGRHADAASAYIGLATDATGGERDRLTLLAVEQWLFAGDGRRARSALRSVNTPASGELLWLWSADSAALSLWEGKPDNALALLEPLSREPMPASYRARIEALRADAWFQKGEPARAVNLYMQRENWLTGSRAINANRERLWAGIRVSDVQALREAADASTDPMARGWLALGALANATSQRGIGWGNGLQRWQLEFDDHPAFGVLDEVTVDDDTLLEYPRQIALLLPLSASNQAAGQAIKNGFLGAYFAALGGVETDQQIRLYDINASGDVGRSYEQAIADGAEFVVGPLLRDNVAALADELMLPVPVLGLNYLPDDRIAPPGFYQFALAPEDEAAAAARRAIAEQGPRAVALVPENEWGRRVLSSFATEFEGLGGTLLDYQSYEPNAQDFSFEIEKLMALTGSVQRYTRLRANIGGPLQFDPRRRQDINAVFLAADAKSGRLLKSQLKFHYAGDLPVYSTSFIHSMDGRSNSDLNGIRFADAPWVVGSASQLQDFPSTYKDYWPTQRRLARLHAMGFDAYQLVTELFAARESAMTEISGATGELFLTSDRRIHRRPAWAQFEGGEPVPLRPVAYDGDGADGVLREDESLDDDFMEDRPLDLEETDQDVIGFNNRQPRKEQPIDANL